LDRSVIRGKTFTEQPVRLKMPGSDWMTKGNS
jgi:hypothetical protein